MEELTEGKRTIIKLLKSPFACASQNNNRGKKKLCPAIVLKIADWQ